MKIICRQKNKTNISSFIPLITLLVFFSIFSTGCGISIDEAELEQAVEETISDATDQAKKNLFYKLGSLYVEKRNILTSKWYDMLGYNAVITYYPREGIDGPIEQSFKSGRTPKLTEETPSRIGYHFTGWTLDSDKNTPEFFPGKRAAIPLEQSTTLYACWEAYNPDDPLNITEDIGKTTSLLNNQKRFIVKHKYELLEENDNHVIRIRCSCGFELIDRQMPFATFVKIVTNGKYPSFSLIKDTEQEKLKKQHILYITQDYAPAAINFIGTFYNSCDIDTDTLEYDSTSIDSFLETLKYAADVDLAYAQSKYTPEYISLKYNQRYHMTNGETIDYHLRNAISEDKNRPYRDFINEYFNKISKISGGASTAIGLVKAFTYTTDALNGNSENTVDKLPAFTKAMSAIAAFMPYGSEYYEALFDTLEQGLILFQQCVDNKEKLYSLLGTVLDQTSTIHGTILTTEDIDQARIGNFDNNPSVTEVLGSLLGSNEDSTTFNELNDIDISSNEKALISWYLSMRLDYEFQTQFKITLEDYLEYLE